MTDGQLSSGHVFVIHGRIEDVVHDVAIVPTDSRFTLEKPWAQLVPDLTPDPDPSTWTEGFGRSQQADRPVWFFNIGDENASAVDPATLGQRLTELLVAIQQSIGGPSKGRALPLVAMPVLGVGQGGQTDKRGEMIEGTLKAATAHAANHALDIAIVTPNAAMYGAVQYVRREKLTGTESGEAGVLDLADRARNGELSLFLGAGASIPSGLPTWGELISQLAKAAPQEDTSGEDWVALVEGLKTSPLDQAQLLAKAHRGALGSAVIRILAGERRPSLAHALLAGVGFAQVLTTNYDDLYEKAVRAAGATAPRQLPAPAATPQQPWVLKIHGSLTDASSIILTRSDFVHFDAQAKPAASVFQSVAVTSHMLMVGVSLNDDNITRLLLEADRFRQAKGVTGEMASLLDISGNAARGALWRDKISWHAMPGETLEVRARELEIFLDHLAMHSSSNSSWLLDERFGALLDPDEETLASNLRRLVQMVRAAAAAKPSSAWGDLLAQLEKFGPREDE